MNKEAGYFVPGFVYSQTLVCFLVEMSIGQILPY